MFIFCALTCFISLSILAEDPSETDYETLKENVMERLFRGQAGLMEKDQYYALIEPYLLEAESKLAVVKYCIKHASYDECIQYINTLYSYSARYFIYYANRWAHSKPSTDDVNSMITQIVTRTKELKDIDLHKEFADTIDLLERGNQDYYYTLGLWKRVKLWFGIWFADL